MKVTFYPKLFSVIINKNNSQRCVFINKISNVLHLFSFLSLVYIAFMFGSAGWVSNATRYDCNHHRRMQERGPIRSARKMIPCRYAPW